MPDAQLQLAVRLCIAAAIGLAAGLEREWSGHTTGPDARFAGLRTFFLLGVTGGVAGLLVDSAHGSVAAALVVGAAALCVAGYVLAVRRPGATTDGTPETAARGVLALAILAGIGWLSLAAGAGAILVLMLREKERLHWIVRRLDETEFRAGVQFAVLAIVVLPLLPPGPFFGAIAIRPRALWIIVLIFSGLNFIGFIARRTAGPSRGLGITGALGGAVSSTAVTLSFSRQSRTDASVGTGLARGVIAACTVLIPRVILVSAVLNAAVALALLPFLLPAFIAGVALAVIGWNADSAMPQATTDVEANPLRLVAAVRMAIAFQVAMVLIDFARARWGTGGIYTTGAVLGVTDIDALTVSMARVGAVSSAEIAARAIAIGILMSTLFKMSIALVLGRHAFRRRAAMSLAALAAASAAALVLV
jgi:uncharacterized membrane protein (DUF4010 family)